MARITGTDIVGMVHMENTSSTRWNYRKDVTFLIFAYYNMM